MNKMITTTKYVVRLTSKEGTLWLGHRQWYRTNFKNVRLFNRPGDAKQGAQIAQRTYNYSSIQYEVLPVTVSFDTGIPACRRCEGDGDFMGSPCIACMGTGEDPSP